MTTMATPTWTFGDKVRKARMQYTDYTQSGFAEQIGVNAGTLSAWESGRNRSPRGQELAGICQRVAALTGVPVAWLLGLDDPTT